MLLAKSQSISISFSIYFIVYLIYIYCIYKYIYIEMFIFQHIIPIFICQLVIQYSLSISLQVINWKETWRKTRDFCTTCRARWIDKFSALQPLVCAAKGGTSWNGKLNLDNEVLQHVFLSLGGVVVDNPCWCFNVFSVFFFQTALSFQTMFRAGHGESQWVVFSHAGRL